MLSPRSLVHTQLDVPSRLEEILFGLIMVMTVTLTARPLVAEGPEGVRQLLIAAVGCNIAWGIIDALMYIMSEVTERARNALLLGRIRQSKDMEEARELAAAEVDERLGPLLSAPARMVIAEEIVASSRMTRPPPVTVTSDDLRGGLACFLLVFLSCLPAALPFLIFSEPTLALRASNAMLAVMLFMAGQQWAHYTGFDRWLAGIVAVSIGLVMVVVAILLGG